jgi:xanthine dehydrogenase accessory factor
MKNIYLQILDHQSGISDLVLATVTRTLGSTPQKPGSSALFGAQGLITGTVGGGIVEGKVDKLALAAHGLNESGHYHFNLANDISEKEEAICGGQISVLIDTNLQNSLSVFKQIKESMIKRIPGTLITMVTVLNERSVAINRYWMTATEKPALPSHFIDKIEPAVMRMMSKSGKADYSELELSVPGKEPSSIFFLEPIFPPAQLIIAGAGHIGKELAHLAGRLNFQVTVIDDRSEYANFENIPDAEIIIVKDIGEAMKELKKTENTYVVIVTRGHADDAAALRPCIGSALAYVGMIGSRNKIAAMRTSFIEKGWAREVEWDQIYAPVGIDIKSQTVEEIAVSIAAQLISIRNSRN